MFSLWRSWRRQQLLRRHRLDAVAWQEACVAWPLLRGLSADEQRRLHDLVLVFRHEKNFIGADDFIITEAVRLRIAAQACLLILNLHQDCYDAWNDIVIYPDRFAHRRDTIDEIGVVHSARHEMSGEAWLQGPVVLSWADAQLSVGNDGMNVVIHEFAHKLDMLNGDANGFPRLHRGMSRRRWSEVFSAAYDDFCRREAMGGELPLDPYAAQSPGEFFAVLSEVFFEQPWVLKQCYPQAYQQLALYYKQDPAARLTEPDT